MQTDDNTATNYRQLVELREKGIILAQPFIGMDEEIWLSIDLDAKFTIYGSV